MMKTLIVYYTWHNGNTKRIAEMIQKKTGADICAIETVTPYPEEYRKASDQGKRETETGFEPEIKKLPYDVKDYERIIDGTPTWWYTMAPAVRTFLDQNDWTGKTVVPFMTNAGWPGTVIHDMMDLCSGAMISNPMEILFDSEGGPVLKTEESVLNKWIEKLTR
jgi:flavodoxin